MRLRRNYPFYQIALMCALALQFEHFFLIACGSAILQ